jgi:Putative peptidoglycan binding domain
MARPPEDEWFLPEPNLSQDEQRGSIEDQWLVADDPAPRSAAFDPWELANPAVLALIGLAVVFFVALLAAAGAFESGSPTPISPIAAASSSVRLPATQTTVSVSPPSSPNAPTTTLKPGDSGSQVKVLQRELVALGFPVGAIDGLYGQATTKAVADFQRAHHLTPDGIVGPLTLVALAP